MRTYVATPLSSEPPIGTDGLSVGERVPMVPGRVKEGNGYTDDSPEVSSLVNMLYIHMLDSP